MASLSEQTAAERALDAEAFAAHLQRPLAIGHTPHGAATGAAGGAACGDLLRISLALEQGSRSGRIADAGFDAKGCGASIAAGSATIALLRDSTLLEAARIGPEQIAAELGGLSAAKQHAAELACDALHRALGLAARRAGLAEADGRTLVAMSGGVDSAVAALIVREQGHDAVGVTLELWADADNDAERSCCSAQAVRSARSLAHRLGLPHLSIDLRAEFKAGVVEPWLADHAAGLTPYACVRCNGDVRLDGMLELAGRLGAQTLVTGHYARVSHADPHMCGSAMPLMSGIDEPRMRGSRGRACAPPGRVACDPAADAACGVGPDSMPLLQVAVDEGKDQSYALAALAPESLARLRFPLGELRKSEVRDMARAAGLAVARKRDSQDLCFLAGTDQRAFLAKHGDVRARRGDVRDDGGAVLGVHDGIHGFTIGQRRGLGLGGGQPRYVLGTDRQSNTVTVGAREQLLSDTIELRDAVLRCDGARVDAVKIRYRGRRLPCEPPITGEELDAGELPISCEPPTDCESPVAGEAQNAAAANAATEGDVGAMAGAHPRLRVRLAEPAERTAAGQLACLYSGDLLVGHGTIAGA